MPTDLCKMALTIPLIVIFAYMQTSDPQDSTIYYSTERFESLEHIKQGQRIEKWLIDHPDLGGCASNLETQSVYRHIVYRDGGTFHHFANADVILPLHGTEPAYQMDEFMTFCEPGTPIFHSDGLVNRDFVGLRNFPQRKASRYMTVEIRYIKDGKEQREIATGGKALCAQKYAELFETPYTCPRKSLS